MYEIIKEHKLFKKGLANIEQLQRKVIDPLTVPKLGEVIAVLEATTDH